MFKEKWDKPEDKLNNLPKWLSKKDSSINRLIAFYSAIFFGRYGIKPTISNWGKTGSLLKSLLEENSEVMIASAMWVYFHLEDNYLEKHYYPLDLLPRNFTKSQVELKVSIGKDFNNPEGLKKWLKRNTLEVIKKYMIDVSQR
jgi:hypothetical protein